MLKIIGDSIYFNDWEVGEIKSDLPATIRDLVEKEIESADYRLHRTRQSYFLAQEQDNLNG